MHICCLMFLGDFLKEYSFGIRLFLFQILSLNQILILLIYILCFITMYFNYLLCTLYKGYRPFGL